MEYILDMAQGVCALYLELEQGAQLNTNTLTDDLERLGLGSVSVDTFPNDDNKSAAAAIFRMRNIAKKSNYVTGTLGPHADSLMRNLLKEFVAAFGGAGAAAYDTKKDDPELQEAIRASLAEQTDQLASTLAGKPDVEALSQKVETGAEQMAEATTHLREATAGIDANMARKEDTDALRGQLTEMQAALDTSNKHIDDLNKQKAKLSEHINALDEQNKNLAERNKKQGYILNNLRGIETELAQVTEERDGLRVQLGVAHEALQRERVELAGTKQQLNLVLPEFLNKTRQQDNERSEAKEMLNATKLELRNVTEDLRALQREQAAWKEERKRLLAIADKNRPFVADTVLEALGFKRARTPSPAGDGQADV